MQHTMTLFVADRQRNEFMKHFDLKPDHKWYVTPVEVSFNREVVDDAFFQHLIEQSKKEEEKWIPAIKYMDNLYKDESVKELSDGQKVYFV